MSNHPHHSLQSDGGASPSFYQPPTGYTFDSSSSGTPFLDSFPVSTGTSTKRRLSAVDEMDEAAAGGGRHTQVRTKRPRRTLAEPKPESNLSKKKQELEGKYGVGNISKDNKVRGNVIMRGNQSKQFSAPYAYMVEDHTDSRSLQCYGMTTTSESTFQPFITTTYAKT